MQSLTIAGNVGKDAVLRRTQSGDAVLGFSLAVDNGKDKNGDKRPATWFDCSIWGKRAESLERHITKGSKLVLQGRPTAREHEGKVYMGISVNELSFMGGGNATAQNSDNYPQGGAPAGGIDDSDIPFMREWR